MAMLTYDDLREIQMDSESKNDSEMEIDEIYSSDADSNESDDESSAPKEQSVSRNWSKAAFSLVFSISTKKTLVFHHTYIL